MNIKKLIPQNLKNIYHYYFSIYYNKKYNYPSRSINVIGVTGTDGKTTTSTLINHILNYARLDSGMITSNKAQIRDKEYPVGFHVTTPDARLLQKFLSEMVQDNLKYVVLETTSHGLDQNRVAGIEYITSVFTNITKEHLDYHRNYANYVLAKSKLITQTKDDGFAVLNVDDESYESLLKIVKNKGIKLITYGLKNSADFMARNIKSSFKGSSFTLVSRRDNNLEINLNVPLPGAYNIYNSLAAIGTTKNLGVSFEVIKTALENFKAPQGRWEILQTEPFKVIVDFAHTPNALENVLKYANSIKNNGKIIVVFGCAGLRDYYKRPVMGKIAAENADLIVLTAEDPRTEKLEDINNQIEQGILDVNGFKLDKNYFKINDRKEAIKFALNNADKNDIVIITGKAHEKSMNLNGKKEIPWDDIMITKEILGEL